MIALYTIWFARKLGATEKELKMIGKKRERRKVRSKLKKWTNMLFYTAAMKTSMFDSHTIASHNKLFPDRIEINCVRRSK